MRGRRPLHQQRQIRPIVDIESDARQRHDRRFDAAAARRIEMRQKAVVAESERHCGRRRHQDRVGAPAVVRRDDAEGRRLAVRGDAAIALASGLTVATRNTADFENIDGLTLANPW